jgi:hypothetical protein
MDERLVIAKAGVVAVWGVLGSLVAAATENTTIAVGTTLTVVVGFAGLLINQLFRSQKAIWQIVHSERMEKEQLREQLHYVEWERECARFRAKERGDPGPYTPLPRRTDVP